MGGLEDAATMVESDDEVLRFEKRLHTHHLFSESITQAGTMDMSKEIADLLSHYHAHDDDRDEHQVRFVAW
jgi:hypothetical protein